MSSNTKPKAPAKESPTEPFKRAVAGCMRALARKPDLEITYAAERPGIAGGKARLPEPPRKLSAQDAAIVRGHADSIALKLACHDPNVHRKLVPGGQQARAVFDAVEQARVEAIGSRRMSAHDGSFRARQPSRRLRQPYLAAHKSWALGRKCHLDLGLLGDRPKTADHRALEWLGRRFLRRGLGLEVRGHDAE